MARRRKEEPVFPQLESMLEHAARGQQATVAAPQPRRSRRRRLRVRSAALAFAALLVCGTALAATTPWAPRLGDDARGRPTTTATPVDAESAGVLGVLRRAQDVGDRGADVQQALALIGRQSHDVHVAEIRLLGHAPDGRAIVLVPVGSFGEDDRPELPHVADALCVFYPFGAGPGDAAGGDYPCWTAEQVTAARAVSRVRSDEAVRLFGLAPDGVTAVTVTFADGTVVRTEVAGNFFDTAVPGTVTLLSSITSTTFQR